MSEGWKDATRGEWVHAGPDGVWLRPAGQCPRCDEDRIVTYVHDAMGPRYYCGVCALEWRAPRRGTMT